MIYAAVVLVYVLFLLGISVYKSRSVHFADDFMLAGLLCIYAFPHHLLRRLSAP